LPIGTIDTPAVVQPFSSRHRGVVPRIRQLERRGRSIRPAWQLHTISWVVRDDAGAFQGVGSLFFTVQN
jgi:hypothetical protein